MQCVISYLLTIVSGLLCGPIHEAPLVNEGESDATMTQLEPAHCGFEVPAY